MLIKAITLKPIWAWSIIYGSKLVENRHRRTTYRGRLAIHAGCNHHKPDREAEAKTRALLAARGFTVPKFFPKAVILGTVDLIDCVPYGDVFKGDPWACGPVCWILENPVAFPTPIPAIGKEFLWPCELPDALVMPAPTAELAE